MVERAPGTSMGTPGAPEELRQDNTVGDPCCPRRLERRSPLFLDTPPARKRPGLDKSSETRVGGDGSFLLSPDGRTSRLNTLPQPPATRRQQIQAPAAVVAGKPEEARSNTALATGPCRGSEREPERRRRGREGYLLRPRRADLCGPAG